MKQEIIDQYSMALFSALRSRSAIDPLTLSEPDMTIEDAYEISLGLMNLRIAEGEKVIGKKIGVTSKAVQSMLNVHQPDFGYLTDQMVYSNGEMLPVSTHMIAPRAEGEIAFILKRDLAGPGITNAGVIACLETRLCLPIKWICPPAAWWWKRTVESSARVQERRHWARRLIA
jgi:2-oxopent-4-enoate/cis-2-oxohex-4-enoate hydratase